jgi:hypothetical protein
MLEPEFVEILLQDPLSKVARQERTRLLVSSFVALVIAKAGIIPTKIEALGVEFSSSNRTAIMVLAGVVVAYFLLTFVIYGLFDISLVIFRGGRANVRAIARSQKQHPDGPAYRVGVPFKVWFLFRALILEFGLPVAAGIYSIIGLIHVR